MMTLAMRMKRPRGRFTNGICAQNTKRRCGVESIKELGRSMDLRD
jgi:hypothetical protein